jgi:hypothetical protein
MRSGENTFGYLSGLAVSVTMFHLEGGGRVEQGRATAGAAILHHHTRRPASVVAAAGTHGL